MTPAPITLPKVRYFPETPGGTVLAHLGAKTEERAWENLMRDARHMPYNGRAEFEARGYKVLAWEMEK